MIKINLLGDSTYRDFSGIWLLIGYAFCVSALVLICALNYTSMNSALSELTLEKEDLEKKEFQLIEVTKEVGELEKKRTELAQKNAVIQILKRNKSGPVRILDDLNKSIPERSWVTDIKESSGNMKMTGRAIDNQTIASFMTDLEKSDYYEKVDLDETKTVEQAGVKLKEFTLKSGVDYSGINLKLTDPSLEKPKAPAPTPPPAAAAKASSEES